MMKILIKLFVVLSILLTACMPAHSTLQAKYTLANIQAKHIQGNRNNITLLVSMPSAGPGLDSWQMLYRTYPYQLNAFADNRWVAPPAQLLMPLLAQSIRNTGCFRAVVTPPVSGTVTYVLNTELLAFHQEFLGKTNSRFRLTLQASVVNAVTSQIIASQYFSTVVPAPANTPYGGVFAANQAVKYLFPQIAEFVVGNTVYVLPRPRYRHR